MLMNLKDKIKLVRIKSKAKKEGYILIKVGKDNLQKYKNKVKDNNNISDLKALLKINRDYYCGEVIRIKNGIKTVRYGALEINVDVEKNKVVSIKNNVRSGLIHKLKRKKLNELFEINRIE